jgi:hypothetical protein
MTMPPNRRRTIGDRVLAWFGKKRELQFPEKNLNDAFKDCEHPYLEMRAAWEGFWSALWRRPPRRRK